jgi:hypothetical protein
MVVAGVSVKPHVFWDPHHRFETSTSPSSTPSESPTQNKIIMAPVSLLDLIDALPSQDGWGPPITQKDTLNGIPYAPFSKGDKLGRMADWTEGKDRDRGGRQQYGRGFRGIDFQNNRLRLFLTAPQTSKHMARRAILLPFKPPKRRRPSRL